MRSINIKSLSSSSTASPSTSLATKQHNPLRHRASKLFNELILLNSGRVPRHKTSRKGFVNPRALDHCRLPPELWIQIIREATFMTPDPLSTAEDLSFLESSSLQLSSYYAAMRFKTNVSLVSKRWNAFVKVFLFEFVWISRAQQAKALAHTLLMEFVEGRSAASGRFIRRLHIDTPVLERCSPQDLHTILEYSPQLTIYTDNQSIQRNRCDALPDPRCSPEKLLSLLTHPNSELRRLSWTSYDDVPFHLRMSPLQSMPTMRLEYLELSSCSPNFHALFSDSLESTSPSAAMSVHLPALRSLKVSLDNGMFAVLASWSMPHLRNLSVVSADFSYTGAGFYRFFAAHGKFLRQLELGHSSSLIEEHYLTAPHYPRHTTENRSLSLARWCPNLRELICSADAEWHWESPDWIAPHVLLPSHPRLEMIAIRDIDARIISALDMTSNAPSTDDTAFFPLLQQMSSILGPEAFPSLKYLRDLSVESNSMRRQRPERAVVQFWAKVLGRCRKRGVWLEDVEGFNVTMGTLKRARKVLDVREAVEEARSRG
ncbi:uncharacterized protein STEHIDRAFT_135615 [Stereum hirsutum FP-91666 SS1]|uniref:Uncharacterized protein n=1 Tax=Stereum hirsutum (strain FP-91666) TaxID=721885 RepID=R7RX03_STEHR|nr:uncharacterized protein STEHIDRAFT_135615 [Stereum hirsutum FP-91666 SS1]EIM79869.1 hypothetical protein STEHIDRAFT_135615 [Stereum hirsutum FP-91666 SS1]